MTNRISTDIKQELIELRLEQVRLLRSKGLTLREIASKINVSPGTIWTDLDIIRKRAKKNISKCIEQDLPNEFDETRAGLKAIIKREWDIADNSNDNREVTMALSLVKECYMVNMEMLTQSQLIDRAVQIVKFGRTKKKVIDQVSDNDLEDLNNVASSNLS